MAATIAITCPKCEKQIKGPADLAGKKIRCKECQHIFVVKVGAGGRAPEKGGKAVKTASGKKGAAAAKPAMDDDEDGSGYEPVDISLLPRCPYCAKELENDEQVICLHCGYNRQTRERVGFVKTYERTGGQIFLWLLPGILCAIGVLILIGIMVVFWTVFPKLASDYDANWWSVFFNLWARLWGSVICLFAGFWLARFAILRLIFHPLPPEKEKKK
jgi:DNA-directed RNA polymerase subunit RPC12/RpoP